jgi:hypothetical protein
MNGLKWGRIGNRSGASAGACTIVSAQRIEIQPGFRESPVGSQRYGGSSSRREFKGDVEGDMGREARANGSASRRFVWLRWRLKPAAAGVAEAVAAVNGTVAARAEGHHSVGPALSAHDGVHLAGGPVIPAAAALLGAPAGPAGLAPLGVIHKAAGVEKLLLANGEYKLPATVHAYQSSVG